MVTFLRLKMCACKRGISEGYLKRRRDTNLTISKLVGENGTVITTGQVICRVRVKRRESPETNMALICFAADNYHLEVISSKSK